MLILGGIKDREDTASAALKVLERLELPFLVSGQQVLMSCSLGMAIAPDDGTDFIDSVEESIWPCIRPRTQAETPGVAMTKR